jgi:hypothetical protein
MHRQRIFLLSVTLAASAATAALGQAVAPAVGPGASGAQGAASIPDFSGLWGHPYIPGFEPPLSGPGPVLNKSRRRQVLTTDGDPIAPGADAPLASNTAQFVGDYTNPILTPQAAESVKKRGEGGVTSAASPLPASGCALLGGASGSAQIKSPAKAEKVQREKDERPHRKLRNAEYRAFSTAAIRVMIASSFSVAAAPAGRRRKSTSSRPG